MGPRLFRLEVLVGQRESPTVIQPFVRTLGRERRRYDDRESTQFPSSSSVGRTRPGAIKLVPRSGSSTSYLQTLLHRSRLKWAGPGCGAFQVVPGQERPQTLNNLNTTSFGPDQAVALSRGAGSGTSIKLRQSFAS